MPFDALPDDILLPIIDEAYPPIGDLLSWKEQFILVSINRRLRCLMLPEVYRCAYITSRFDSSLNENAITTSLDIAVATGNVRFVCALIIDVCHLSSRFVNMTRIVDVLKHYADSYPAISDISVCIKYQYPMVLERPAERAQAEDELARSAQDIVQMIPNIKCIGSGITSADVLAKAFCSRLVNGFAAQLKVLHYYAPLDLWPAIEFNHITNLSFELNPKQTGPLPRICPDIIQYLYVTKLPASHTWGLFGYDSPPESIELPSVIQIYIRYATASPLDSQFNFKAARRCKIHTPRLQKLEVHGSNNIPFVSSIVCPEQIGYLDIVAKPTAILNLAAAALPKTRRLKLWINNGDTSSPNLCNAINHIFNSAHGYTAAVLNIYTMRPVIGIRSMKCPSLTVLTIQHAVNATALIEIITRHPNLESATIENLETNRLPPGIVAPDSDDGCRCAPLHNKLSKLSLSDHYIDRSRKIYLTLVMYFALRLPSLRELTIGGALHGAWDEFVWSHSVSYPHLEAIELKI